MNRTQTTTPIALQTDGSPLTEKKLRLEYVDCLRGVAMFLVVYSHVLYLSVGQPFDITVKSMWFRMPMFFFISGLLSYAVYTRGLIVKRIKNRLVKQLMPTVICWLLACYTFGFPLLNEFGGINLFGYWFTYAMVIVFLIYIGIVLVVKACKMGLRAQNILYTVLVVGLFAFYLYWDDIFPKPFALNYTLCLNHVVHYLPFFLLGIMAKLNWDTFISLISNGYFASVCLVVYIWLVSLNTSLGIAYLGFVGIGVMFAIFYHYRKIFSQNTKIGRVLSFVGRNTLAIYLFHYFIIYSIKNIRVIFYGWGLLSNWFSSCIAVSLLAISIIAICLLMSKILEAMPPLRVLLLGAKK